MSVSYRKALPRFRGSSVTFVAKNEAGTRTSLVNDKVLWDDVILSLEHHARNHRKFNGSTVSRIAVPVESVNKEILLSTGCIDQEIIFFLFGTQEGVLYYKRRWKSCKLCIALGVILPTFVADNSVKIYIL